MLLDAGIEPTLDSSPEKLSAVACSRCCFLDFWTPVVKALALKID